MRAGARPDAACCTHLADVPKGLGARVCSIAPELVLREALGKHIKGGLARNFMRCGHQVSALSIGGLSCKHVRLGNICQAALPGWQLCRSALNEPLHPTM